jgi:3-oxoacyl-[acyl-carrier protein] reductase
MLTSISSVFGPNLWPNRIIGDLQPETTNDLHETNITAYKSDSQLLPSGLIGRAEWVMESNSCCSGTRRGGAEPTQSNPKPVILLRELAAVRVLLPKTPNKYEYPAQTDTLFWCAYTALSMNANCQHPDKNEGYVDLNLKQRTALVLGGGLGRAISIALAGEGASVAFADIESSAISGTQEALKGFDGKNLGLTWDLADLSQIDTNISKVEEELGPVDILVNITGGPPPTPAGGQDPATWSKHFQAMVLSVIAITDRVLPGMKSRRWGRVITSTSSGVVAPIPNLGISNALRLTLVGWSKTLAREVGRDGVTCNIVVPGRIATKRIEFLDEMKAKRENHSVEEVSAESTGSIPLGRYGKPEEYADMVTFLASDRAAYITGSVVRIDGGLIASV